VDDARRRQLIDEWAVRLEQWGLTPVAPIVLQMLRPLGFLGSQAVLLGQPFLTLFTDAASLTELSLLLDDPEALDQIEQRLTSPDSQAS